MCRVRVASTAADTRGELVVLMAMRMIRRLLIMMMMDMQIIVKSRETPCM